jgi:hypothetical protein
LGTWAYSVNKKWPGHETDLLPLSRADVKNVWNYVPAPPYITLAQCIIQKRNYLTSYLIQGKVSGSDAVSVVQAVLPNVVSAITEHQDYYGMAAVVTLSK